MSPSGSTPRSPDVRLARQKARLRARLLAARQALPTRERETASAAIAETLTGLPAFRSARGVHCFISLPGEVDTGPLFAACVEQGKITYVPYQDRAANRLGVARWQPGAPLAEGPFGVREPPPELWLSDDPPGLDLVVVPGLAFDRSGRRLGYGKGYYDRFLTRLMEGPAPPVRIGVAFSVQLLGAGGAMEQVPVGPRDVPMDEVVTESGLTLAGKALL